MTSLLFFLVLALLLAGAVAFADAVARRKHESAPDIPLWYLVLQVAFLAAIKLRYRFRIYGLENLPATGGVLIAPAHFSYIDGILICAIARRRVRFLIYDGYDKGFMKFVIKVLQLIPISPTHAKSAIEKTAAHLAAGDVVGIFPEGQITRNGALGALQGGYALMARRAKVPVVPVAFDGLWGSSVGCFYGKALSHLPRLSRPTVAVAFGAPLPPDAPTAALREAIGVLAAELFARRPEFSRHVGEIIVHRLTRHPGKVLVIDRGGAGRMAFRGATLLALAHYLAKKFCEIAPDEKRIAILLPPSIAATAANIACVICGKVPVNLNFTLGRKQFEGCIAKTGVKTFITAQALRDKLDERVVDFPWGAMERIVDIAPLLKNAPKGRLVFDIVLAWVLPGAVLSALWRVPRDGGEAEAMVLCTSGSSGMPKGVPLSHKNILTNCAQFSLSRLVPFRAIMLGNLPIFHSFGITVTLWFPLLDGITVVSTPSPLEIARNLTAIRSERVSVLVGTPTFFRGYMKKATPEDLASVQLIVAGAEKLPEGFADEWENRFGGCFIEGYGATEMTPVAAISLRDVRDTAVRGGVAIGTKRGSVGLPVTGVATRFTSPLTGEPVRTGQPGLLWVKGGNVFKGYIDDPVRTKEVLASEGWYCTGDIARLDEDGFIFIEGRHSRFSKIGGEMVPHGTIEDAIRKVLGFHFGDDALQRIAVSARDDDAKGESLVLLTTVDVDADALRAALLKEGCANLWLPRYVKKVDAIPVLATGKLDLQGMRELAACD
ncbi:MAG: AMP-binding protein [Puniceicoccales bacterium]|jgi:acyl-[acyl-carrier-protein]-phospholipid O-acyltransferase/long-chain-fatty-acid--[acyl-carrier-protein] ligase|nr:AMP-binding protein [Puniceicoccales bacterium]